MVKKVIKFPSDNERKKHAGFFKMPNVEFENQKDEKDLMESLRILDNIITAHTKEEREKIIQNAAEKSYYNVEAQISYMRKKKSSPSKFVKELLDYRRELQMAPIKVKDFRELYVNDLYKLATDILAQYYCINKIYGKVAEAYNEIIFLRGELTEFEDRYVLLTVSYLELNNYSSFSIFYSQLSEKLKEPPYILLCKLIFDIRRDDEEAAKETLGILKYNNPDLDSIFEIVVFEESTENVDEKKYIIDRFLAESEELVPYLREDYVRSYLLYLNSKVYYGEELDRKMKARGVSLDELKKKTIFSGLTPQCINSLRKAGLIEGKDFLEVTKSYLLNEVSYVGKKSVEQLQKNGIKFKGDK